MNNKLFISPTLIFAFLLTGLLTGCNQSRKLTEKGWEQMDKIRRGLQNDATLATNYFDRALVLDPKNARALHGLGVVLSHDPKTRPAGISHLKKAIKLAPADSQIYLDLVQAYRSNGRYKKALDTIEEVLKKNPRSVKLYATRALLHTDRKNFGQAESDIQTARKIDPENEDLFFNLALIKVKMGDYKAAESNLRRALALNPANPDTRTNLARTLLHLKKELEDKNRSLAEKEEKTKQEQEVLEQAGKKARQMYQESLRLVNQVLETHPTHAAALKLRRVLKNQTPVLK